MISKKDISKLEGLLYLYAVSKTNSKREVAGKLGTSVDTVSKYLADLENELKTYLLVSNGRGTVITPEGERILDAANDIVRVMRSIGDTEAAAEDDVYNGIVKISMPDSVAEKRKVNFPITKQRLAAKCSEPFRLSKKSRN